jgi:hypothetical protein
MKPCTVRPIDTLGSMALPTVSLMQPTLVSSA